MSVQASPHIAANAITLIARSASEQADAIVTCRIVSAEFPGTFAEDTGSGPHAVANC